METTVCLHLSKKEAEALLAVTCSVGGDPYKSRRKDIDALRAKVRAAGVCNDDTTDISGSIGFKDTVCAHCGKAL